MPFSFLRFGQFCDFRLKVCFFCVWIQNRKNATWYDVSFWIQMRKNKNLDESHKTGQTSGPKMAFNSSPGCHLHAWSPLMVY
ncbi:hypothetical protein Hanom_Chr04g00336271 [Helianthus anomalus]